jgi:large subunit ribosomal protein L5
MIPRLKQLYRDEVVAQMMTDFGFGNVHEVPRLEKIVVNIGLGEAIANARSLDAATNDMALITGQ